MTWDIIWPLLVAMGIVLGFVPIAGLYATFIERKLSAYIQDRLGPNRVGPAGLLQAVADGIKIFLKEQVVPGHVFKSVYFFAPTIGLICAMLSIAVVPFGPASATPQPGFRPIIAPGVDIGILFLLAVSGLSAYGIILGGWASNNKYSLYGAIRSCAQFISYEIPLGLSLMGVIAIAGSLNLETIVAAQGPGITHWNVWWQPLAALLFFTAALAETNRLPFDLSECEQELVGGFHTEYGGIKFVLFFLAEYTHVVTTCFLTVLLFFGGWHFPGLTEDLGSSVGAYLLRWGVLLVKVIAVLGIIMQLRWTLPRFRFDQLMGLAWKGLIPLGLGNLAGVIVVLSLDLSRWWLSLFSIGLLISAGLLNVALLQNELNRRTRVVRSDARPALEGDRA
ncbi:MAG: NADH-quinone oxidoreductase subunit NuoH [Pirellulales bacterium]